MSVGRFQDKDAERGFADCPFVACRLSCCLLVHVSQGSGFVGGERRRDLTDADVPAQRSFSVFRPDGVVVG